MVNPGWDKKRILSTPLTLYMEYINLKRDLYLKEKTKDLNLTHGDITYIVNIFYHENVSQRELAEILYVSEANVAKIVKRLDKNGYIERISDESNKSRKLITLTEEGKSTALFLIKSIYEWESNISEEFQQEDIDDLRNKLYQLTIKSADN